MNRTNDHRFRVSAQQKQPRSFRLHRIPIRDVVMLLASLLAVTASEPAAAQSRWLTGRSFDDALGASVAGTVSGKPLREVLTELGVKKGLAIVLDRRVNPNRAITIDLAATTRLSAIRRVAAQAGATVSRLDNILFVGPPESAGKLRTLIELRRNEIARFNNRRTLRGGRDISWPMLAEPRRVLTDIAAGFAVTLPDQELPHDLWAAAALPDADAATALSVVLIQFGFTFAWAEDGQSITFVPEPGSPALSESVRLRREAPTNLLELARQQFPRAEFTLNRSVLRVTGSFEAIEAAKRMAKGEVVPGQPVRQPMANQRFTMKAANVPARAVLQKLVSAGNDIVWDEASLGTALDKRIDIDVVNARPRELFESICRQIGANFEVELFRVRVFLP